MYEWRSLIALWKKRKVFDSNFSWVSVDQKNFQITLRLVFKSHRHIVMYVSVRFQYKISLHSSRKTLCIQSIFILGACCPWWSGWSATGPFWTTETVSTRHLRRSRSTLASITSPVSSKSVSLNSKVVKMSPMSSKFIESDPRSLCDLYL